MMPNLNRIFSAKRALLLNSGWFVLAAGMLFLGGCSTPPASPVPTAIPTSPPATATVAVEATMPPPQIATAVPSPVPDIAEPPTVTPEPTAETNLDQGIAALLQAGFPSRIFARYPSPDGSLEAQVHIYDCTTIIEGQEHALDVLRIVNIETEAILQDAHSQLQVCGGLGTFGIGGLFWSPSGRFFYFTDHREGTPDGCGYWSRPISRVDLTDMTITDIGSGPQSFDGNRLAVWEDGELVIWAIDGDEIGRVAAAADGQATGEIVWSPDDTLIAYLQADQFCEPEQSTVVLISVDDLSTLAVLPAEAPAMTDIAWYGPDKLIMVDTDGKRQFYDLATGEFSDTP